MKKLFLLLCVMFALQAAAYDFMVDGIAYTKTSANTVEVTQDASYKSLTRLNLVETVTNAGKTYMVTSIGERSERSLTSQKEKISSYNCDVNGDGKVDPDDWNVMVAITLGEHDELIDIIRADIDGNGTIDISDLNWLENEIINNHPIDVVRYRGRGDVDGNGVIEDTDYNLIYGYIFAYDKDRFLQRNPDFGLDRADVKLDGNIDGWDYFIVRFLILNGWTDPNENSGTSGDVDGNGSIGIEDVNAVINVMLGKAENAVADVNVNGSVGIEDVNAVINFMLGKQ